MNMLEIKNLTVQYGSFTAANDISFRIEEGQWLMLIGPNGAGKSTIINAISGGADYSGSIYYKGTELRDIKPRTRARYIGTLSQNHNVGYSFTVGEIVRLGRYAHSKGFLLGRKEAATMNSGEHQASSLRSFADMRSEDDIIDEALSLTGLLPLKNHSVLTLSGGELQRTFLAQVFAQDPQILLLDEPTNHLDLIHQKLIFELVKEWIKKGDRAVISVVHDLSLARAYGTHGLLLNHANTAAYGSIEESFKPEVLNSAYGMDVAEWMQGLLKQWE